MLPIPRALTSRVHANISMIINVVVITAVHASSIRPPTYHTALPPVFAAAAGAVVHSRRAARAWHTALVAAIARTRLSLLLATPPLAHPAFRSLRPLSPAAQAQPNSTAQLSSAHHLLPAAVFRLFVFVCRRRRRRLVHHHQPPRTAKQSTNTPPLLLLLAACCLPACLPAVAATCNLHAHAHAHFLLLPLPRCTPA